MRKNGGLMRFFDLHCDTPYRMFHEHLPITSPALDCPLPSLLRFERAVQVMAIWSDSKKSEEENFSDFFRIAEYLRNEIEKHADVCALETDLRNLSDVHEKTPPVRYILAVEGGALLNGKLERLERLYREGVRIFTPMWKGINSLGGAHDTKTGLSPFGEEALALCDALGITVDVSHMSDSAFEKTKTILSRPFIASHSNSRAVFPASRNLTDGQFDTIRAAGGLVGLNLYPPFVADAETESDFFAALARHAVHFLRRGGENTLCLGGDRDGIPRVDGYTPLSCVQKLYFALLANGISEKTANAIFYDNAAPTAGVSREGAF